MQIQKVFNNNALLVLDKTKTEKFIMGKGIGFKKKPGDELDESQIEKQFICQSSPQLEFELARTVLHRAENDLKQSYFSYLTLSLATYFHQVLNLTNSAEVHPLSQSLRETYPQEYQFSEKFLTTCPQISHINMTDALISQLALQLINAQQKL